MKKFLLQEDLPEFYILMYSAKWYSACKEMKMRLENSDIAIYELDVDTTTGMDMARAHDVRSLPTYFVCQGAKHLDKKYGCVSENELKEWLSKYKK